MQTRLKLLLAALVCGVLLSMATGLVENRPEISVPENRFYGYPLVWRTTSLNEPTGYVFSNLMIDWVFWTALCFLALFTLNRFVRERPTIIHDHDSLFLAAVLSVPLGLVMDFVHELGHAGFGMAVGGRLVYMKVTFLEVYPQVSLTSTFVLGLVQVEGLRTQFDHGLYLLGGSLSTNMVAWVMALILLRTNRKRKRHVALWILGFFGVLDLPFYVFFPQIGLQHWIFLGGSIPEPLIGAREMGVADPLFYLMTAMSTLGLIFIYLRVAWRRKIEKHKTSIKIKENIEKKWSDSHKGTSILKDLSFRP